MSKMFLIPLMTTLIVATAPINATIEFPDVNSFMPSILEMVPLNGQLRVNDQIFNFGTPTPSSDISTEKPESEVTETPNNVPQTPDFESRTSDASIPLPNVGTLFQSSNNGLNNQQNFDQRTQNQLPQPSEPFPQSFSVNQNPSNFETRIPSLDSILANMRPQSSQNSVISSLPNIGSTEMGATFARNANNDFRDEFSESSASTPIPFGFPRVGAETEVRSNFGGSPTESPLVVMPLVVSPNRLMQRMGSSLPSNPVPIPALFASANDNMRASASERMESLPVSVESIFEQKASNKSVDDSAQVISRQSTLIFPEPTVRQLTNETLPKELNLDAVLDRHVRAISRNATERAANSTLPSILTSN